MRGTVFTAPWKAFMSAVCLLAAGMIGAQSALAGEKSARAGQAAVSPQAMATYSRVAARVKVSAERLCRDRMAENGSQDCRFVFAISGDRTAPPNAFQSMSAEGRPMIILTARLLEQLADEHQIAFVLSHEAAHHVAGHIERMNRRGSSDAFLPGAGKSRGKGLELEADWVGAFIAEAAGYDPQAGARVFSRNASADVRKLSGSSSHPSPSERHEVVAAASAEIARQRAAGRTPRLK
jgi:Zn-dependent protease with chaperone function